jgi:hypothetical protein
MVVSHNREIQSSSTTDSNIAPTCESIDQLTCPSNSALVISAARLRPFTKKHLPTQFWISADEGKQCAVVTSPLVKLPNARRGLRKAVLLPAQGQGTAPIAGAAHSRDFGVGCQ